MIPQCVLNLIGKGQQPQTLADKKELDQMAAEIVSKDHIYIDAIRVQLDCGMVESDGKYVKQKVAEQIVEELAINTSLKKQDKLIELLVNLI